MRILVIEDDPRIASFLERGLAAEGYQVAAESDGLDGLERARNDEFDLLILDRMLPRLDGLTALEIARRELPEVPFIFLSGTSGEERAVEAMRRGAADYVLKTNASRLAPAVLSALREVGARARLRTHEEQIRERNSGCTTNSRSGLHD